MQGTWSLPERSGRSEREFSGYDGAPWRAVAYEEIEVHRPAVAFALQQAETGTPVEEVCRKMGVSQATFYRWKKVYGGLMPSEDRRLRQLEE